MNIPISIAGNYFNRIVTKEYEYRSSSANALLENLYDTKIVENNLELSASLDFTRYLINANARLFYVEQSENHSLLNVPDFHRLRSTSWKRQKKIRIITAEEPACLESSDILFQTLITLRRQAPLLY